MGAEVSTGEIKKVCVIGSGVMGAGIAAQVANSGVPVLLLDIVKPGDNDRDSIAKGAVAKMLKTEPAPFMSKSAAKLVETGQHRGPPRQGRRLRPGDRGDHRAARPEAGSL